MRIHVIIIIIIIMLFYTAHFSFKTTEVDFVRIQSERNIECFSPNHLAEHHIKQTAICLALGILQLEMMLPEVHRIVSPRRLFHLAISISSISCCIKLFIVFIISCAHMFTDVLFVQELISSTRSLLVAQMTLMKLNCSAVS